MRAMWHYAIIQAELHQRVDAVMWFALEYFIATAIAQAEDSYPWLRRPCPVEGLRIRDLLDWLLAWCDHTTPQTGANILRRAVFLAAQAGLPAFPGCDLTTLMNCPFRGSDCYADFCSRVHGEDFAAALSPTPTLPNIIGWLFAVTVTPSRHQQH